MPLENLQLANLLERTHRLPAKPVSGCMYVFVLFAKYFTLVHFEVIGYVPHFFNLISNFL